ncbi:MAG TPA: DUF2125 domain-containing protein [Roseiarcus sp.]|nr:DUF2125 domain-containing protein [Roseiarcus sp.]
MRSRQIRFPRRALLLATAALGALSVGASAKDLPATPEGAKKVSAFLETFVGKPAAGATSSIVVTPESADYLVAVDIGALAAPLKSAGVSYDAAVLKFKAIEQDDGAWRIEQSDFPTVVAHSKRADTPVDSTIAVTGLKTVLVIDPAISWVRSGQGSGDKVSVRTHGPGIEQTVDFGPLQATATSKASADGALSTNVQESVGAFGLTMTVDPKAASQGANPDAKPVAIAAQADGAAVELKLDGVKPRPLLDLWAFLVAHPSRPELAANEAQLKTLLTAALASPLSLDENFAMKKLTVQTPQGPLAFDGVKAGIGGAAAGSASRFEERFSASGLTLPPGLVPAMFHDLVPTSFDVGFKVSGFDLTAASAEAIADMHLAGDAPPISEEDNAKVWAKLTGAGPALIDIPPSHVVAPQLDIAFEGRVRYQQGAKPSGTFTVHMRNFEKTQAALKGLGPETEKKLVPVLAMAKGLAKTDGDGALTWVGELGADGMMKVNGLPLGKAPL